MGRAKYTHLTGVGVRINGRTIQRCALCGMLLVDSKYPRRRVYDPAICGKQVTDIALDGIVIEAREGKWRAVAVNPATGKVPAPTCIDYMRQ